MQRVWVIRFLEEVDLPPFFLSLLPSFHLHSQLLFAPIPIEELQFYMKWRLEQNRRKSTIFRFLALRATYAGAKKYRVSKSEYGTAARPRFEEYPGG